MKDPEIIVDEYEFYRDENGKIKYYQTCRNCTHDCKQSYKVKNLYCNNYEDRNAKYKKRSKREIS